MRGRGGLGGRVIASRSSPIAIHKKVAQVTLGCLTESFNIADGTTIGPDLPWLATTYASMRGAFEIKTNALAFKGTAASATSARSGSLRAEQDVATADHASRATWSAVGALGTGAGQFTQQELGVYARLEQSAGGSGFSADPGWWQGGAFIGYWLIWGASNSADPFIELQVGWVDPGSGGAPVFSVFFDGTGIPAPSGGDELSLTVTGTGDATAITGAINGTPYVSLTGADLVTILSIESPDLATSADLPQGLRGGVSTRQRQSSGAGWTTANDYVNRYDSFSVCPA